MVQASWSGTCFVVALCIYAQLMVTADHMRESTLWVPVLGHSSWRFAGLHWVSGWQWTWYSKFVFRRSFVPWDESLVSRAVKWTSCWVQVSQWWTDWLLVCIWKWGVHPESLGAGRSGGKPGGAWVRGTPPGEEVKILPYVRSIRALEEQKGDLEAAGAASGECCGTPAEEWQWLSGSLIVLSSLSRENRTPGTC